MPSEPLRIFDPRRNFRVQGFSGRAATTTIHEATETGISISGIFQAAEDFAVLCLYNACDCFITNPSRRSSDCENITDTFWHGTGSICAVPDPKVSDNIGSSPRRTHVPFLRVLFTFLLVWLLPAPTQSPPAANLTEAEVEQLEASLVSNPQDSKARTRLVGHYFDSSNPVQVRETRRHILWLIRNQPESPLLASAFGALVPKGTLADRQGYAEAEKLWRELAAKPFAQPPAAANAIEFFKMLDRDLALRLTDENMKRFPDYPHLVSRPT